jgi:methyl-accepting chemotaxis protein
MKKPTHSRHRKQLFSNPAVQGRIMAAVAVLAVLYGATAYYMSRSALWSLSGEVLRLPLSDVNRADVRLLLEQQSLTLNIQMALFIVLVIMMLMLGGLLMSHRIGGPIYQLVTYLRQMARGTVEPRRIRFRKHDFFHELADAFNDFQEGRGILRPGEAPKGRDNSTPKADSE